MDVEDGDLSAQIVWTSSLDGQFGMGQNFMAPLTTVGVHVITAEVMDNDANVGTAMIMLNIIQP
jgi:serine protease